MIRTRHVKIILVLFFPGAPTVSDLRLSQILELAVLLDTDNGWKEFGDAAFGNDNVIQKQLSKLHRCYFGGGNPVFSFLISLTQTHPKLTVKEFVSRCRRCGRNDIVLYASENLKKNDVTLRDLKERELRDFADEIFGRDIGINDWHDIASEFPEYSLEGLKKIDATALIPNSFSPTKELFYKIRQFHPKFKLEDLKMSCERNELRRMDVALKLGKFINELSAK